MAWKYAIEHHRLVWLTVTVIGWQQQITQLGQVLQRKPHVIANDSWFGFTNVVSDWLPTVLTANLEILLDILVCWFVLSCNLEAKLAWYYLLTNMDCDTELSTEHGRIIAVPCAKFQKGSWEKKE